MSPNRSRNPGYVLDSQWNVHLLSNATLTGNATVMKVTKPKTKGKGK